MLVLAVTWMAKPGREAEVIGIFQRLQADSRREPGCRMYVVHQHTTEPRRFFLYEQYDDEAALQAHRSSPHFQEYAVRQLPQIAERVQGDLYQPLGTS
ncbi:MAG TPA: putative quinol monooxygenase [Terriglobales bacterium]|nr:putative quinol monooxygenase [Terriglobales bacterium]